MRHILSRRLVLPTSPARRLNILYILALSAVALLSVLSQVLIQYSLTQQTSDAHVINLAGRQRMLSQRLSKAALAFQVTPDPIARQQYAAELQQVLTLWEQSHDGLQHGSADLELPNANSAAVTAMFAKIAEPYETIRRGARRILDTADASSSGRDPTIVASAVAQILAAEPEFLSGMDRIVFQYDEEATTRVRHLQAMEYTILAITLGTLLLECLLVFRPAVGQIRTTIDQLLQSRTEAARAAEECARTAEERLTLQEQVIAAQREAFESSTPLIPVTDEAIVFPLIGTIDTVRGALLSNTVLQGIVQRHARITILDLTGIACVEPGNIAALLQTVSAARLLGTEIIFTGIRPDLAQALVENGVGLDGIRVHQSLQEGIRAVFDMPTWHA